MNWRTKPWRRRKPMSPPPTVPWDYAPRPGPDDPVEENLPCEAGRKLGAVLARLADAAEIEMRKTFPDNHPRCSDCAFRAGTRPNGCLETVLEATKCAVEGRMFYCHKGVRDGCAPKVPCAGALLLYDGPQHDLLVKAARHVSEGTDP